MQTAGIQPDAQRLSREGLAELVQTLGDHPLSIELVGPHLAKLTPRQIIDDFDSLLERFSGDAEVERNRSLLASLRFSTDRLSPEAQAALPWLGLFRGGVFEQLLLDISQIAPDQWDGIRGELEATALIRVEDDIQLANRPYLRFHPTLPYAAQVAGPLVPRASSSLPSAQSGKPGHRTVQNAGRLEPTALITIRPRASGTSTSTTALAAPSTTPFAGRTHGAGWR